MPILTGSFSLETEWQHVCSGNRTLLSIQSDLNNAVNLDSLNSSNDYQFLQEKKKTSVEDEGERSTSSSTDFFFLFFLFVFFFFFFFFCSLAKVQIFAYLSAFFIFSLS